MERNKKMKTLIFTNRYKKGNIFLEKLVENIPEENMVTFRKSTNEGFFLRLKNGDTYQVVLANHSSRGCKYHRVYIDKDINIDFVYCVILPMSLEYGHEEIIYFD